MSLLIIMYTITCYGSGLHYILLCIIISTVETIKAIFCLVLYHSNITYYHFPFFFYFLFIIFQNNHKFLHHRGLNRTLRISNFFLNFDIYLNFFVMFLYLKMIKRLTILYKIPFICIV